MKKIFIIIALSLCGLTTFAAKKHETRIKLKKQVEKRATQLLHLSYTTTCGTTEVFDIASEKLSSVGWVVDYYNDKDCGTHWWLNDVMNCPCP